MERKIPKNIRQIGNVSDSPKIYVEDYVDTFFNQLCEKAVEEPVGAFLIGESHREDQQDYLFVNGAIEMQEIGMKNNEIVVGDKTWKKGLEECKAFFNGKTIVGWVLMAPNMQLKLDSNLVRIHEKLFQKKTRILVLKDPVEKEEVYHVYKYNDLMEISGHYVYYEKNQNMQDYMIAKRKQNCVSPSEAIEDRATKDFRSIINEKEKKPVKKKGGKFSSLVAALLLLVVVIMGVTALNDPSKIKSLKTSISNATGVGKDDGKQYADNDTTTQVNNTILGDDNQEDSNAEDDVLQQNDATQAGDSDEGTIDETDADADTTVDETTQSDNATAAGEVVSSGANKVYIVEKGDTIAAISRKYYGSMSRVKDICELNALDSGDYIIVGQEIKLP